MQSSTRGAAKSIAQAGRLRQHVQGGGCPLSGRIYQRGKDPRKWTIRIELGRDPSTGKRLQKYHAFRGTKRQAEAELARLVTQVNEGTYVEDAKLTVAEFLAGWLKGHAETKVAPKTYRSYKLYLERDIIPRIGALRLKRLTPPAVKQLVESMQADGLGARTIQYAHATLRTALSYAVEMGWITTNPAAPVSPPQPTEKPLSVLDATTAAELLRRLEGNPVYLPTLIALHTGMRRGEILGLAWSHVDMNSEMIYVSRALGSARGGTPVYVAGWNRRKNHQRAIAVAASVIDALRRQKQQQSQLMLDLGEDYEDHDLIVCRADGRPWDPDDFTKAFRAALQEIGVTGLRFHDLRHTHLTLIMAGGIHPRVASERAGHSDFNITMKRYSHVAPGMDRPAAELVERLLTNSSPTVGVHTGYKGDKKGPRR